MREYEAVFIFQNEDESYVKGKEFVKQEFDRVAGAVNKEQDMGSRDLAYMVKKQERGRYFLYEVSLDPEKIDELSQSLKLNSSILKFLFVRKNS